MKGSGIFFVLMLISPRLMAQIFNGDFESWNNYGYYEDPTGWFTNNSATSKFGVLTVLKDDSIPYSGRASADLISKNLPLGGVLPGFIYLGSSLNPDAGMPFDQRPESFTAWFQYIPRGKDTCIFNVTLTRRNPVTHLRDTVATSTFYNGTAFRYYVNFISPFIYNRSENPDTMHIYISSSGLDAPPAGSIMRVDNLTLNGLTGIRPVESATGFSVFPNPVNDKLNIFIGRNENGARLSIFDTYGDLVEQMMVEGTMITADISHLAPGIYFFQLIGKHGELLDASSFEKVR
jgi:Secretion system C-terminal sorting domain